jgi:hypothetical protein
MGGRIVAEFENERMAFERGLDDAALDAAAAPVNDAHLAKSRGRRGIDVLSHDRWNVAWRKAVKVELSADRNANRKIAHISRLTAIKSPSALVFQPSALSP